MATSRRMLHSAVGSRGFAQLSTVPVPGLGKGTERGFALQPTPGKPAAARDRETRRKRRVKRGCCRPALPGLWQHQLKNWLPQV